MTIINDRNSESMWKTLSSKELYKHPRLTLIEDEVLLPSGATTQYLKYGDNGGNAATVVARREDGKILLQTEYSYPMNEVLFQFPGGSVPAGEDPEVGANRELMEEAKLRAGKLEPLGFYYPNNRRSSKKMFMYLATDLKEASLPGDPEEDIASFWVTEKEINQKIRSGEIVNVHALAAWMLYLAHKQP